MEDFSKIALTEASKLGAGYADVRIESKKTERFRLDNDSLTSIDIRSETGAGTRVLQSGSWGFYATNDLTRKGLKKAVAEAFSSARKAAKTLKSPARLAPTKICQVKVAVRVQKKPEEFPMEERVRFAKECAKTMREMSDLIRQASIEMSVDETSKWFASTEGARIQQDHITCIANFSAVARSEGLTENVSQTEGGTGGLERILDSDPLSISRELGKKAAELLSAPTPPDEKLPVVMDPDYLSLVVHEIIGHPSEADRVLGREAAWAGVTWWRGMLGQRIGSEILNASDNSAVEGTLGYYKYDDEGVEAEEKVIFRNGVLTSHMQSRETATEFGAKPNGGMRALSYQFFPLVRMSNTFIKPGNHSFQEIVEGIDRGIYIVGSKVPAIDNRRYNWQISGQWAYMIEKGEVTHLLRDPTLMGVSPEFFKSISAVGKDLKIRPRPGCAKGDPVQSIFVGNGGPHIRAVAQVLPTRGA
jgi:TldD protein